MAIRKIAMMHRIFGTAGDHVCRECCNLVKGRYHGRTRCKCRVYGMTHSEATDWAGRWLACGAFNREISRGPIFREVIPERKRKEAENTPIEGQVRMEV